MFGRKKSKGLYYLMPGMTRANRHKRRRILRWAVAVGILTALLVGAAMWYFNRL
ncbi:MAG: hypothetical protein ACKVYV_04820 [Limisphaerales bacterium]